MKVLVYTDLEGITGVVHQMLTKEGDPEWQRGRKLMTGDVNSAVEGAIAGGAQEVLVLDSHGWNTNNILIEELHPDAKLVQGTRAILDPSFSAVLCIGFHAGAGAAEGVLSHTVSSLTVSKCILNDRPFGEFLLVAGTAGYHNVPTVLITGDQVVAEEARALVPKIETVIVKRSMGWMAAELLPPAKTHPMIREGAIQGLLQRKQIHPLRLDPPFLLEIEFKDIRSADVCCLYPGVNRPHARKIFLECKDFLEVSDAFWTLTLIGRTAVTRR